VVTYPQVGRPKLMELLLIVLIVVVLVLVLR